MNIKFYEHLGLPIAVIDNFYEEQTCKKIWQELCFLNNEPEKLLGPEKTGSATDQKTGEFLKHNKGRFLDAAYNDRSISNILVANRKIFCRDFIDTLSNSHYFFKYLQISNIDKTLIQYYEDSDYYKSHCDLSTLTAIFWIYDAPKKFVGGNFHFENGPTIECFTNRMLIFPSILNHEVEETKIVTEELKNQNYGRFSISQFISRNI